MVTVAGAIAQLLQFLGSNIVSVVLVVVTALASSYYVKRPRGAPPGPRGWPVVGSLVSLAGKHGGRYLKQLSEEYGPIFSLYMGSQFAVVLNTVDLAREAFKQQGEVTSGRNYHFLLARYLGDENEVFHGISFTEEKRWKEQRRFALSKLREFGMGKVSIEKKIQEEASVCLAHLRDTKGEPLDPQMLLNNVVINVIASIVFGKRYDYDDPAFHKLVSDINELFIDINLQGIINYYPWLRHLPTFKRIIEKLDTCFGGVQREILDNIAEHERRYAAGNDADFIDAYLQAARRQHEQGVVDTSFTDLQLEKVLMDLFFAGSHTVMTTIRWALLFMLKYPDVMRRVHAEIDDVIGQGRLPCTADQDDMPYTRATIAEVQRVADIVPLGLPHMTTADIKLEGYSIPARAMVIANLTSILNDPKYFPEPEMFSPERHLDAEGKFVKIEAVIPFSIGRRACPGEALARMELFLFFTSILQNYDISLPDGVTEPSLAGDLGIVWMAKPYQLCCVPRE